MERVHSVVIWRIVSDNRTFASVTCRRGALATLKSMQGHTSGWIKGGAALVALEALALLALAVAAVATLHSNRLLLGATNAAFFCAYGAGLAVCARGLLRLRSWSRGPVVLAQLIQLGIAWSFASRATAWLSVVLAVSAVLVLAVVLAPSTTTALYGGESVDGG
jgi:hypothetical protein